MSAREKRRKTKNWLLRIQQGLCFFCYRAMSYDDPDAETHATLFSLDDRNAPWRGRFPGTLRHVVSCRGCADDISQRRILNVPIGKLHQASGHQDGEATYSLAGQSP